MALYNISYDILNEGGLHDYQPLWKELKDFGAHPLQDGLWMLEFDGGLEALAQRISALLDAGDRLFIAAVHQGEFYHRNNRAGADHWLSAWREEMKR